MTIGKGLNFIIGSSGSGKTTLIVAIGMAFYLGINFLQLRRINQIPLMAALKNRK